MADRYWYGVKGAKVAQDILEATTSQTSTVELRVTYTSLTDKIDVLLAIDAIKAKIQQDTWAPA